MDEIDPGRFREAVLLAWRQRPLDERRDALDRLIEEITLSEGGTQVAYRVKDPSLGFRYQEPYGPPSGSWGRYRVRVEVGAVRRPRARRGR